jgi:hypothetical protein
MRWARRWRARDGWRDAAPGSKSRDRRLFLAIGGSSMSPSRYSRLAKPCFFASCAPNSTIFGELSIAMTLRAVLASKLRKRALARAEIGHGQRRSNVIKCAPAPARNGPAHNCGRICPRAHRNIRAPCPGVCANQLSAVRSRDVSGISRASNAVKLLQRAARASVRSCLRSGRNKHFSPRGDLRPRRPVLVGRDDSKCATAPSREFPATRPRKVLPVREEGAARSRVGSAIRAAGN